MTEEEIEGSVEGSGEGSGMDDSVSEEQIDIKTGSVGRWLRIPKIILNAHFCDLNRYGPSKKDRLVHFLAHTWSRRADILPLALPHYATLWFLSCNV